LTYSLFIERRAQRALARIARPEQERIITAIRRLMDDPRPSGTKKLTGRDAWRIHVGDYRVIYEIHAGRLLILVVDLGHRRDIYR
jgi:mRNA interferase RelE/StbE